MSYDPMRKDIFSCYPQIKPEPRSSSGPWSIFCILNPLSLDCPLLIDPSVSSNFDYKRGPGSGSYELDPGADLMYWTRSSPHPGSEFVY